MTRENSKQTDNPLLEQTKTNAYEDIVFMKDCIDAALVTQSLSQSYSLPTNKSKKDQPFKALIFFYVSLLLFFHFILRLSISCYSTFFRIIVFKLNDRYSMNTWF